MKIIQWTLKIRSIVCLLLCHNIRHILFNNELNFLIEICATKNLLQLIDLCQLLFSFLFFFSYLFFDVKNKIELKKKQQHQDSFSSKDVVVMQSSFVYIYMSWENWDAGNWNNNNNNNGENIWAVAFLVITQHVNENMFGCHGRFWMQFYWCLVFKQSE